MRRALGIALMVVAVLCLVAGAALAIVLGPDNRTQTGPHPVETDGIVVVTTPGVLGWRGPTISVLAELPDAKPVFVGVANPVDVDDYLKKTARLQVDSFDLPWGIATSQIDGRPYVPAAPTDTDWWLAQTAGEGGTRLTFRLPDGPAVLAVVALGDNDLSGLQVTLSYVIPGGFGIGLGLLAVAFGFGIFGWIAWRRAVWEAWEEWDDDEDEEAVSPQAVEPVAPGGRS